MYLTEINGKNGIRARVVAASLAPNGVALTTMELRYPRFILAELNTHRTFCLEGDSVLTFDLPGGAKGYEGKPYTMTIREFVEKWHHGAAEHRQPSLNSKDLEVLDDDTVYTAKEMARLLGFQSPSNIRGYCREGRLPCMNKGKARSEDYLIRGSDFKAFEAGRESRTYSLRSRLEKMKIRQMNETTGRVQRSTVVDCCFSGVKSIWRVNAGGYNVAGSEDHQILTDSGWKPIKDIQPGVDSIMVQARGKLSEDRKDPMRLEKIDGTWVRRWNRQAKQKAHERQQGLCASCNEPLGEVYDTHHIIPVHQDTDKAFDLTNIEALHPACHKQRHLVQGWQDGHYLYGELALVESVDYEGESDTYDLWIDGEFANFLANGVVVHNSRNTSSSRAIPSAKIVEQVQGDPAMPVYWGLNQPGMQAADEEADPEWAADWWLRARAAAVASAEEARDHNLHKQIANRILEPWMFMETLVSSTEWPNFFQQRLDKAAQPEFRELAECMSRARAEASLTLSGHSMGHFPYTTVDEQVELPYETLAKLSSARCCRVSYLKQGESPSNEDDIARHDGLRRMGHWCYDDQTEVLTPKGWRKFSERDGEEVAEVYGWGEGEFKFHFVQPSETYSSRYEGDMYLAETPSINYCVTPNHRMLIQRRTSQGYSGWHISTAEQCFQEYKVMQKAAKFTGGSAGTYLEGWYIGFMLGDGFRVSSKSIACQLKKSRKVEKLTLALQELGKEYKVTNKGSGVLRFSIADPDIDLKPCTEKELPTLLDKSEDFLQGLFDGLMDSDGAQKHSGWVFSSSSEKLFAGVQFLATLIGRSMESVKVRHRNSDNPKVHPNRAGIIQSRTQVVVGRWGSRGKEKIVHYEGSIHCVSVPSGMLLVRRKGKQMVCGNSPFEHVAFAAKSADMWSGNFRGWIQYRNVLQGVPAYFKAPVANEEASWKSL